MIGEEHKTWKSQQGKTMFSFFGVIDGVTGIFSSTKNTGSFKPGEKIDYESKPPADGAKYPKFTLKRLDESGVVKEYKDPHKDMTSVRSQCYGLCAEIAIRTFTELARPVKSQDDIDKVTKYYYDWAIKEVKTRDSMYERKSALSNAVDSIKHSALALKSEKPWGLIIALAEHYLEQSLAVKESDKIPTV
jgi:hypothetical protein